MLLRSASFKGILTVLEYSIKPSAVLNGLPVIE